jgi:hypothetical protein
MADIIQIPDNFIGLDDRQRLESFGGHSIAHGRATRWHWGKDQQGDDVFEIYRGGADEVFTACLSRDRKLDAFCAHDERDQLIASGELDHVLAALEHYLMKLHGELPDAPA